MFIILACDSDDNLYAILSILRLTAVSKIYYFLEELSIESLVTRFFSYRELSKVFVILVEIHQMRNGSDYTIRP